MRTLQAEKVQRCGAGSDPLRRSSDDASALPLDPQQRTESLQRASRQVRAKTRHGKGALICAREIGMQHILRVVRRHVFLEGRRHPFSPCHSMNKASSPLSTNSRFLYHML